MNELIRQLTAVSLAASVLALVVAMFFYFRVKGLPEGTDTMNMIARYIREGSMAFLVREYKVLAVYSLVVFVFLFFVRGPQFVLILVALADWPCDDSVEQLSEKSGLALWPDQYTL